MRRSLVGFLGALIAAASLLFAPIAGATEMAAGVLLYQQINASTFRYNIVLQDIGSTNVGTLWYSWVPGEDFLAASPTNIVSPAGWSAAVTHAGAGDGFAVQWVNSSGPLTPGGIVRGFGFDSQSTPAQLSGNSQFFNLPPIATTFVYSGAPLASPGGQFEILPTAAPWRNPFTPLDVNNSRVINPQDALVVINALLAQGTHTLVTPTTSDALPPFIDVNGDNKLSPLDALNVINHLLSTATASNQLGALPSTSSAPIVPPLNVPEPESLALAALAFVGFVIWAARDRLRTSRPR